VNKLFCILLVSFLAGKALAQNPTGGFVVTPDSTKAAKKPAPKIDPLAPSRAAFYSAILPGLGQVHNKKYWKVPIVYGAMGTSLYFYFDNNKKYNQYRDAYKRRLAGFNDDQFQYLDDSRLIAAQRFYQRNRDLSLLIAAGFYILNIVDANVDAHLMQFNVSDDLSVVPDVYPNEINQKPNVGLTLNFKF
jgi:hypothetical protein